eukprot:TRINITY_DN33573_c0_g1_i1.p1 TRINITY_DN33573_c0_g1~~TRINITY_DN33573_c0_g1_i1.p1  ORF type:complete len:969 (+),score=111.63 TRINITY_DN33573_c0_g1_i1:43-2949(+)
MTALICKVLHRHRDGGAPTVALSAGIPSTLRSNESSGGETARRALQQSRRERHIQEDLLHRAQGVLQTLHAQRSRRRSPAYPRVGGSPSPSPRRTIVANFVEYPQRQAPHLAKTVHDVQTSLGQNRGSEVASTRDRLALQRAASFTPRATAALSQTPRVEKIRSPKPSPPAEKMSSPLLKAAKVISPNLWTEKVSLTSPRAESTISSSPRADKVSLASSRTDRVSAPSPRAEKVRSPKPSPRTEKVSSQSPRSERVTSLSPPAERVTLASPRAENVISSTPRAEKASFTNTLADGTSSRSPWAEMLSPRAEKISPSPRAEKVCSRGRQARGVREDSLCRGSDVSNVRHGSTNMKSDKVHGECNHQAFDEAESIPVRSKFGGWPSPPEASDGNSDALTQTTGDAGDSKQFAGAMATSHLRLTEKHTPRCQNSENLNTQSNQRVSRHGMRLAWADCAMEPEKASGEAIVSESTTGSISGLVMSPPVAGETSLSIPDSTQILSGDSASEQVLVSQDDLNNLYIEVARLRAELAAAEKEAEETGQAEITTVQACEQKSLGDLVASRAPARGMKRHESGYGTERVHRKTISALASECHDVSTRFEQHLKELKLLASAMNRTAGSPPTQHVSGSLASPRTPKPSPQTRTREILAPNASRKTSVVNSDEAERMVAHGDATAGTNRVSVQRQSALRGLSPPKSSRHGAGFSSPHRSRDMSPSADKSPRRDKSPRGQMSPRVGVVSGGSVSLDKTSGQPKPSDQSIQFPIEDFASVVASLSDRGMLSETPRPWAQNCAGFSEGIQNDLEHVRALAVAQLTDTTIIRVLRVENSGLTGVYNAVRDAIGGSSMKVEEERILWHGTSADSVRNIVTGGFNRAYCGRHGTKFGQGTYFSSNASYSARFCDRRRACRTMILARVFVGAWARGSPGLMEPPYRDQGQLKRYDSTTDSENNPTIFCVFRDFQALPLYIVEFSSQ